MNRKEKMLVIRISEEELQIIKEMATSKGLSTSKYVRQRALRGLK